MTDFGSVHSSPRQCANRASLGACGTQGPRAGRSYFIADAPATVVREGPGLWVAQCLPGPGQDAGVGAFPIAQALHLKPVFATLARQVADGECGHLKYLQKV